MRLLKILAVTIVLLIAVVVAGVVVLKSVDPNRYRGLIAKQVESVTGRKLTITGDLDLGISLNPSIIVGNVALANPSWASRPEMATAKRLEAEVELIPLFSGELRLTRIRLEGLDLLLETNAKGRRNWKFKAPARKTADTKPTDRGEGKKAASDTPTISPLLKEVQGTNLTIAYRDRRTGQSLTFMLDALSFGAEDFHSPLKLVVDGVYGDLEFSANGELGSIGLLDRGGKPYPIAFQGKAAGISMSAAGTVTDPFAAKGFALSVSAEGGDLSELAKATGKELPALPDWRFSGKLTGDGKDFSIGDLDAEMAENKVSGRLALDLKGARPAVKADLASKQIDLGPLLSDPAEVDEKRDGRVFSAEPLPFDALVVLDADVSLAVERLLVDKVTLEDVEVKLHLRDGRLKVAPARGKFAGGEVTADISVAAGTPPALELKANARQLHRDRLLELLGIAEPTKGPVDFDANLTASGDSVRQIMAGLDGHAHAVTTGGKFENSLQRILAARLTDLVPFFEYEGDDNIHCGLVDFDIDSGRAKSKALVLETGDIAIVGEGKVNLRDETLDIEVNPRAKTVSLMKLTSWRILVGGTLASPSVEVKVGDPFRRAASGVKGVVRDVASAVAGLVGDDDSPAARKVDPSKYCVKVLGSGTSVPEQVK